MLDWLFGEILGVAFVQFFLWVVRRLWRGMILTGRYLLWGLTTGYWNTVESRSDRVRIFCGYVGLVAWLTAVIVLVRIAR